MRRSTINDHAGDDDLDVDDGDNDHNVQIWTNAVVLMIFMMIKIKIKIFSGNPRPRVTWSKVNQADVVGEGEALELREVGYHHHHQRHHHHHHHHHRRRRHHHHYNHRYPDTTRESTSAALATELGKGLSARFTWGFYVSAIFDIFWPKLWRREFSIGLLKVTSILIVSQIYLRVLCEDNYDHDLGDDHGHRQQNQYL